MWSIHPSQIEPIVRAFAPHPGEIDEAAAVLSAAQAAEFSIANNFYLAAFNHLTPFPGTPLYTRLQREGRLLHERWWLDERYRYNDLPFRPGHMSPDEVRHQCIDARRRFYSWKSMLKRAFDPVNRR